MKKQLQDCEAAGAQFPPSPQRTLWCYLKPRQQREMAGILGHLKLPAQKELCCAMLDYLESGEVIPPADLTLGGLYYYLIQRWQTLTPITSEQVRNLQNLY